MKNLRNYRKRCCFIAFLLTALTAYGQANQKAQPRIDPTYKAAVKVHNPNTTTLKYKYRWGTGDWYDGQVTPFQTMVHSYNYQFRNYTSPAFEIRYDSIAGDGKFTPVIKELKRTKVSTRNTSGAVTYYFWYSRNRIMLSKFNGYDANWVSAIKIENKTNFEVKYDWQWEGSTTWNKVTLKPGYNRWFAKQYYPGVYHSPKFKIRFDMVLGDGKTTWQYYDLERNKAPKSKPQDHAKLYYFDSKRPSVVDLYKSNN